LIGGHGTAADAPASTLPLQFDTPHTPVPDTPRTSATRRTTVLPRRTPNGGASSFDLHPRFQRVKTLGEGAMGRVELVRDNDIRRTVAVKHLLDGTDTVAALSRFADEVRVIGQLEHPGIVPVYDVDKGEDGQLYLVMKHLQGDAMEQVIDRLRAGDSPYTERFSLETRVRIFLGVLDAVRLRARARCASSRPQALDALPSTERNSARDAMALVVASCRRLRSRKIHDAPAASARSRRSARLHPPVPERACRQIGCPLRPERASRASGTAPGPWHRFSRR